VLEADAVSRIAAELKLAEVADAQKVKLIGQYFARLFEYGFWEEIDFLNRTNRTPLTRFLLETRKGHCEFFATATVLLLRQAGVPARYVAGYSVQEGAGGNRYVVRERHAHAWCLYYDYEAKQWKDLDTTPGTWVQAESNRRSWFEPIKDAWERLVFEFSKIRWGQSALRQYLTLGLIPVVILLIIRFALKKRWMGGKGKAAHERDLARLGLDSEFYRVEEKLASLGLSQVPGETLAAWIARVQQNLPPACRINPLLLRLHYRLRFDPVGLGEDERAILKTGVRQWLEAMESAPAQPPLPSDGKGQG
jgi:hypothetical protein